ncbi:MAG: LysR family transcriptional regulator [Myxococcota bacterium]
MSDDHDLVDGLSKVDLNLLVAFDVLARTLSVTRAAKQLGVTQSAASHTLRRLRELLDDPLLVRVGNGLALTPRGEGLAGPVRSALVALGRTLAAPEGFDPATTGRTFRLCAPDLFDLLVLPSLMPVLAREAPLADLAMVPAIGRQIERDLETGDIDVAIVPIGALTESPSGHLVRRSLLEGSYRCFLRADHPAIRDGALSLAAYAASPHVLVSPTGSGEGFVDRLLADVGCRRRIALRVPSFFVATRVVARTDLILTGPASLASVLDGLLVVSVPPPIAVPEVGLAMLWHQRFGADPGHTWLRALLVSVAPASVASG